MTRTEGTLTLRSADIIFRNFQGEEGQYNRKGDKNFAVKLDAEIARQMEEDGWNVKYLKQREDEDEPQAYVQVAVGYKGRPPAIWMITSRGRTALDEDSVEMLDWVDFSNVDLIIRPYNWVMHEGKPNEMRGVKAYLKSMFATIEEDELELDYADVPEISGSRLEVIPPGDDSPPWDED